MPRTCTICTHPARATIDDRLITGSSLRTISGQYGLSKSAVDRHKDSHLPVLHDQDEVNLQAEFQAARQADHRQFNALRKNASAAMKAFEGWGEIRSLKEWQAACDDAATRYQSGRFLLERLGAERFLDPQLMATLWQLRQGLMEEYGAESPAMMMVIDLTVMAYANALRVQGWIGDLALAIEHELFGEESLRVKWGRLYGGPFDGFAVEEPLRRLREQLLPLCERLNRQLLSNLQGLRHGRSGAVPTVAIGQARQVNIAQQQVNLQQKGGGSSSPVEPR